MKTSDASLLANESPTAPADHLTAGVPQRTARGKRTKRSRWLRKPHARPAGILAAALFAFAATAPGPVKAGEYEEVMAVVEDAVGPIGEVNTEPPGAVTYQIVDLALQAKALKASGDEAGATAKALEAVATVAGTQ